MMKKLLAIVVLAFILVSCSSKKESALENCADSQAANYKADMTYPGFFYRNLGGKDKEAEKLIKKANKLYKKITDQYSSLKRFQGLSFKSKEPRTYGDNVVLNLLSRARLPTATKSNVKLTPDLEQLDPSDPKVIKYRNEIMDQYEKKLNSIKLLEKQEDNLRILAADKYNRKKSYHLKKSSLKTKSQVPVYADWLEKCELQYNRTPDSFLLRWANK